MGPRMAHLPIAQKRAHVQEPPRVDNDLGSESGYGSNHAVRSGKKMEVIRHQTYPANLRFRNRKGLPCHYPSTPAAFLVTWWLGPQKLNIFPHGFAAPTLPANGLAHGRKVRLAEDEAVDQQEWAKLQQLCRRKQKIRIGHHLGRIQHEVSQKCCTCHF